MTNWEWFAPALTFLTAVGLWVANRWREDKHRFTDQRRTAYVDLIRARGELEMCVWQLDKLSSNRPTMEGSGNAAPNLEAITDFRAKLVQFQVDLERAHDKIETATIAVLLLAPTAIAKNVLAASGVVNAAMFTPQYRQRQDELIALMRVDLLGRRKAIAGQIENAEEPVNPPAG